MNKAKVDLRERTKDFALSVVRMFSALPKTTDAALRQECDELTAIFVTIIKQSKAAAE